MTTDKTKQMEIDRRLSVVCNAFPSVPNGFPVPDECVCGCPESLLPEVVNGDDGTNLH